MAFTRDDVVKDTPTNTFATLNPLAPDTSNMFDMTEGNLRLYTNTPFNSDGRYITTLPFVHTMGKIYFEIAQMTDAITIGFTQNSNYFGIYGSTNQNFEINAGTNQGGKVTWQYRSNNGNFPFMNTSTTEVVGLLINFITNEFTIYLATANYTYSFGYNNWINFDSTSDIYLVCSNGGNDGYARFNFGQDPTFASTKVPTKVYTDASGHGRFFYEPPAGAMALCTANLDTANLQPAEYIVDETNQHMLTYNGNAQISKFSPYATDGWSMYSTENSGVSFGSNSNFNYLHDGTTSYTISGWIYRTKDSGSAQLILDTANFGSGNIGVYCSVGSNNLLNFQINRGVGGSAAAYLDSNYAVPLNQWIYFAITHDTSITSGNDRIKLYVNGVESGYNTRSYNYNNSASNSTRNLHLGVYDGTSLGFPGYISDFRIIQNVNAANYAVPTSYVSSTGTVFLLSTNSKQFVDSSSNAYTSTLVGSPEISDWSPYQRSNDFDTAFFRAKDNYYGGSFKFDGNGDKLDMGDNEDWSLSNGDFTFRFWMYGNNNSITTQHVFAKWSSNKEIRAYFEGSASNRYTTFKFEYKASATPTDPWVAGGTFNNLPITPNSWNYIVFVNSGGTTSLYVNGASMTPTNNTITGTIYNSTDSLWIGSNGDANAGFAGYIADFEFEKTAISNPTDIPTNKVTKNSNTKLLLQPWHTKTSAGVMSLIDSYPQDETGKSLTYYDGATIVDSSPYKGSNFGSFSLDGVSQYVFTPDHTDFNLSSNDFTIEQWVKLRDLTASTLLNQSIGGATSDSAFIFYIDGSASLAFYLTPGTTWDKNTSGYTMSTNVWYHVAAVRNGNTLDLYVNGNKVGTTTDVTGYVVGNSTRRLQIGAQESLNYLNGIVTDARIVNGQALYTTDFIPPAYPLSATHYTTDGTDPATSSTKQSITGTVPFLTQPGKVTKRNNVAAQDPEKHFKAVTYDGNGGTKTVTGIEFQPDFVWIKSRSNSYGHNIHDVIRGPDSYLSSHSTVAENTDYANICVLNSNGFTLSSSSSGNVTGTTNVAWCWKAGGAPSGDGVAMIDGSATTTSALKDAAGASITPTRMSVNTKAGFSIVKWQASNGSDKTVPHGLSNSLDMIIMKNLDTGTYGWHTSHIGLTTNHNLILNGIDQSWNPSTSGWVEIGTGSVFNIKNGTNGTNTNNGTDNYIAYCWHSVAGYSAFGSFTGNNSTDGPFIYTGFKPAFLMVKLYTGTSNADYHSWVMYDNSRITYNPNHSPLYANRSHAEGKRGNTAGDSGGDTLYLDLLSNGFKCRQNGTELNGNGGANDKFIYAAFAEQPIKFSNAR